MFAVPLWQGDNLVQFWMHTWFTLHSHSCRNVSNHGSNYHTKPQFHSEWSRKDYWFRLRHSLNEHYLNVSVFWYLHLITKLHDRWARRRFTHVLCLIRPFLNELNRGHQAKSTVLIKTVAQKRERGLRDLIQCIYLHAHLQYNTKLKDHSSPQSLIGFL